MSSVNVALFAQITSLLDRTKFGRVVLKHNSDKHSKGINTWTHLISMIFLHLAKVDSVRDISKGLRSACGNLNHLGVKKAPSKSSMSYINQHRSWEVFKDYYFALLEQLEPSLHRRRKYGHQLKRKIFLIDSTTISLCLSLFDWAKYRTRKGAIKLHTVLDYDTTLPVYMQMTEAKKHDVIAARQMTFPSGSVIVMDRAYVDYAFLNDLDSKGSFFVTRIKDGTLYDIIEQYEIPQHQGELISDQDIQLTGVRTSIKYPQRLRLVTFRDAETGKVLVFLTNQLSWTAKTIADLYKSRWEIEVFFKQIKQVLRIKTFIGTSANAVLIQVWTAMIAMLIVKYLVNRAKYFWNLSNLVTMIRIHLFVKIDIGQFLDKPFYQDKPPEPEPTLF